MKAKHIATCWSFGFTGNRTGTCYFYSEAEIKRHRQELERRGYQMKGLRYARWYSEQKKARPE